MNLGRVGVILSLALVAFAASAELKPQGTVVKDICSTGGVSVSVSVKIDGEPSEGLALPGEICLASVTGLSPQNFVTIDNQVWQAVGAGSTANMTIQRIGQIGPRGQLQYDAGTAVIMGRAAYDNEDAILSIFLNGGKTTLRGSRMQTQVHTL